MSEISKLNLRITEGSIVTPGDRIGSIRSVLPGDGTYCRGGHVLASRVGRLQISSTAAARGVAATGDEKETSSNVVYLVSVVQSSSSSSSSSSFTPPACHRIISNQQLVICLVTRLHLSHVVVHIVASVLLDEAGGGEGGLQSVIMGGNFLPEGMIRREDVKSSSTSSSSTVEPPMDSFFRPGDWILGRIVSLGDSRRYWISTAEPELGVIRMAEEDDTKDSIRKRAKLTPSRWEQLVFGNKVGS
jgi:exosome complex component CSL4